MLKRNTSIRLNRKKVNYNTTNLIKCANILNTDTNQLISFINCVRAHKLDNNNYDNNNGNNNNNQREYQVHVLY